MELRPFQQDAVEEILEYTKLKFKKDGTQKIVFKSPTGSGKTVMMASFLERFVDEIEGDYAFIWLSVHDLHNQSKESLERNLKVGLFTYSNLQDISDNKLSQNEILFVNWESITKKARDENPEKGIKKGDYINTFMADNETDRNLNKFIQNSKEEGRSIVLIIDESHLYGMSEDSIKIIENIISPRLVIEVSATPNTEATVEVPLGDVIEAGMIKKEVVINQEFQNLKANEKTTDEIIIEMGVQKQLELEKLYKSKSSEHIRPLLLVQLPSEAQKTSDIDRSKIEEVKTILKDRDITMDNGKLAIWLSDQKTDNLEGIEKNDSPVEVLIFKQAIATGWDCPRAQVLIMFRETKSITFEIQTVGRIMRMPELKHYESEELNKAYIFTNLANIDIAEGVAKDYIRRKEAFRKDIYTRLDLLSVYLPRKDYNDLLRSFYDFLINACLKRIGADINSIDWINNQELMKKHKVIFDTEQREWVLANVTITDIDKRSVLSDQKISFKTSPAYTKEMFKRFALECSTPFAPVRSHTVIQEAIYALFDNYLGYKTLSRLDIQRIVLNNADFFRSVIHEAKETYKEARDREIEAKANQKRNVHWEVPERLSYPDTYVQKTSYKRNIFEPSYVDDKWETERHFIENYLEQEKSNVQWWFKSGTQNEIFLGIPYKIDGKTHTFYPDFIVQYSDGRIGIFDTKKGKTAEGEEPEVKSEALKNYIEEQNKKGRKLFGGLILPLENGKVFKYFQSEKYL